MITENLEIPIYCRRLHIIITGDFSKDIPEINKKFNQECTEEDNVLGQSQVRGAHHMIILNVGKHRKIFKGKRLEAEIADTISHECVHACNQLFKNIGATVDQDNDEPQAYLVGWFVKQVTLSYLKFKEKENGKMV